MMQNLKLTKKKSRCLRGYHIVQNDYVSERLSRDAQVERSDAACLQDESPCPPDVWEVLFRAKDTNLRSF